MDSKKIAKLAKKFAKLEKELDYTDDVEAVQTAMEALSSDLTPEELIAIDDYMREHHLL